MIEKTANIRGFFRESTIIYVVPSRRRFSDEHHRHLCTAGRANLLNLGTRFQAPYEDIDLVFKEPHLFSVSAGTGVRKRTAILDCV